eukprot:Hpha_TRINITY_DN21668_c0_g1::TRINITY_DN21668_c0_g1_i1::g.63875::m.63875
MGRRKSCGQTQPFELLLRAVREGWLDDSSWREMFDRVKFTDRQKDRVCSVAASSGQVAVLRFLFLKSFPVVPCVAAANCKDPSILRLVLEFGSKPDRRALLVAARSNKVENMRMLIERGVSPDVCCAAVESGDVRFL